MEAGTDLYDAGLRQQHADVANIPSIAQHLVHNVGHICAGRRHLQAHVLHILLPKFCQFLHRRSADAAGNTHHFLCQPLQLHVSTGLMTLQILLLWNNIAQSLADNFCLLICKTTNSLLIGKLLTHRPKLISVLSRSSTWNCPWPSSRRSSWGIKGAKAVSSPAAAKPACAHSLHQLAAQVSMLSLPLARAFPCRSPG